MLNIIRTGAKQCLKPQTVATFERGASKFMNHVDRVAPQEIRKVFQDGIQTGANFVKKALLYTGMAETAVMVKKHVPEAGESVLISSKQALGYYFPKTKFWVRTFDNLHTFGESVDAIMSNEEMSDEEIGKALLSTIKNAIESWIKISKKPKAADELLKLKEAKEEITKIIDSDQFDKDAAKNCIKKLTKLFFSNIGNLIDGTTLPKRWLELAKKLGVEKLFENYSQTDIDADGQISWGVPGLESNKDDVDKQNTVSDTKKQEQKSDSDVVVKVKVTDSDPLEQAKELEPISESKNRFLSREEILNICKTISDNFQQAEGFQVNEEKDPDELQEICNDPTLPETEKKLEQLWLYISKDIKEYTKGIFPTYSPIDVDIDGHEILGIWEA